MQNKKEVKAIPKKNLTAPLQKKSVALLVFLSIITAGIYTAIWYIKRSPEFDKLGTQKKLSKNIAIIFLILVIIGVLFNSSITINEKEYNILKISIQNINFQVGSLVIYPISFIINLSFLVSGLFLVFRSRTILNEQLLKKGITRKVSWFFTLIFGFLYIQYEINRIIENREYEKRIGPWVWFIVLLLLFILLIILFWVMISLLIGMMS